MVAISILMVGSTSRILRFPWISCGGPRFIGGKIRAVFVPRKNMEKKENRRRFAFKLFCLWRLFGIGQCFLFGQSWQLCLFQKRLCHTFLITILPEKTWTRMEVVRNRPRFPRDRTILITLSRAMHPYNWQMVGFCNCSCCSTATGFRSVLFTIFCWFPFRSLPSPQTFVQDVVLFYRSSIDGLPKTWFTVGRSLFQPSRFPLVFHWFFRHGPSHPSWILHPSKFQQFDPEKLLSAPKGE